MHVKFFSGYKSSGNTNTYFLNNKIIQTCQTVKDLGLIVSSNLKWVEYIEAIRNKANRISFTIFRSFKFKNICVFVNLYKTYVRPLVEYNTCIWNPYLQKDINRVESIQRQFTKRLCKITNTKFSNYTDRLKIFKLETLEVRRIKNDLKLLYKIFHNLIDIPFENFFTKHQCVYNLRGHNFKLSLPKHSSISFKQNFFSYRVVFIWNKLPSTIVNFTSLQIFKSNLDKFDL